MKYKCPIGTDYMSKQAYTEKTVLNDNKEKYFDKWNWRILKNTRMLLINAQVYMRKRGGILMQKRKPKTSKM